ncbi:hypothetical protein JKP88DRAFT_249383 [Tribonema minus]|uniref:Uncharacterized protein n=1 Tax=Tribonema minus TaxID=303371 RepID=A0A835YUE0_9STRA|nr:hypothetical protein JKP88DRAFT_249383 [Tribonema minus]
MNKLHADNLLVVRAVSITCSCDHLPAPYFRAGTSSPMYQLQAVVCSMHDSGSYDSGHYTTWSRVEDGNFVHFNLGEVSPRGHSFTESPSSSGSPTRHSPDEQDEREETDSEPPRRRINSTQGRRPTMQDADPAESDCSDDSHSTVAEADSDDKWQFDADATESEKVYDPLMDDAGEADDGSARTLDGHRQTIAECVTGRGVLSHLASGLGDVNVRTNLGRDRTGVTALSGALSMTPARRQEKLALDGGRLLLAPDARAPRHGGPLSDMPWRTGGTIRC